jgi:hypothetical protein
MKAVRYDDLIWHKAFFVHKFIIKLRKYGNKFFFPIWKHQVQANELNNLTIQKSYNTSIVWIFCLFSLVLYVSHAQHCDLFLCIVLMKPRSGIHYEYSIWLLYGILLNRVYLLIYNILTSPYNSCKFFFTDKILRWTHNSCKIFLSPKIHSKLKG